MISRRADRASSWWLGGLHLLLTLSIPFLLLALAGCMKAKEKQEDLGPEVSSQTVNDALGRVAEQATLDTLAKDQYIRFITTRRIENGDSTILLGQKLIDVLDRQDTSDQARFTIRIQNATRLIDGKFEATVSEEALWLDKVTSAAVVKATGLKPSPLNKLVAESLARSKETEVDDPVKITFHHFREGDEILPASDTLQAKTDCAGLSPCEIPVHVIHFDMVMWDANNDYQKITFDFAFSLKTPMIPYGRDFDQFSGLLVADCRATYIPIESRSVYVRDCMTLDDFKK